jgi:NADPH2:quinone reductase
MGYKKVIISKYGPPEVLQIVEEQSLPEPRYGDVRVKVLVTSAAFTDTLLRKGMYPEVRKKPPLTPGYDMVGIVDWCGEGVTSLKTGERVAAMTVYGAYTEYMCLPQESLTLVPDGLDSAEVVSLILTYMTAYQMLHRSAKVHSGQTLLVHGAGGAVGTALLQLGKLLGLKMYGTARKSKHDLVERLGGIPIDYQAEDFVERIKREPGGGVDAVFDCIGGDYFKRSFRVLRPGGILVAYGFQQAIMGKGGMVDIIIGFLQLKLWNLLPNNRKALFYSITSMRKKHPEWFNEDLEHLMDLLKQRKIQPVIARKMPLTEAVQAHRLLDRNDVEGKIVLVVHEEG